MTYCLLADPSQWMRYEAALSLVSDAPDTFSLDTGPLTLTFTDANTDPVQDVLVCLSREGEEYQQAVTDAIGQVTFTLNPETLGWQDTAWTAGAWASPVMSSDGQFLFLANRLDNKIAVIDPATAALRAFADLPMKARCKTLIPSACACPTTEPG